MAEEQGSQKPARGPTTRQRYRAAFDLYMRCLNRQERLLAGYFAVAASGAMAFVWLEEHRMQSLSWIVPALLAVAVTPFFRSLLQRNRDNYLTCNEAAAAIEQAGEGVFTKLEEARREDQAKPQEFLPLWPKPHWRSIATFFRVATYVGLAAAALLLLRDGHLGRAYALAVAHAADGQAASQVPAGGSFALSICLIVVGLLLSLVGAYVASTLPLVKMCRTAGSFGGGKKESWEAFDKEVRRKTRVANTLLVLGTLLQIVGSLAAG